MSSPYTPNPNDPQHGGQFGGPPRPAGPPPEGQPAPGQPGPGQPGHAPAGSGQQSPPPQQHPGYGPPPQYAAPPPTQQWPTQQWSGPPQPPDAPGGGSPFAGGAAGKSFFLKLFDLSFREFVTPAVIKVLYVLAIVGVVFAWLVLAISGFRQSVGLGLFLLFVIGPLYALFLLILARVSMEFYIAVIRIAEDVRDLKKERRES